MRSSGGREYLPPRGDAIRGKPAIGPVGVLRATEWRAPAMLRQRRPPLVSGVFIQDELTVSSRHSVHRRKDSC
jgi:hypothetical protein